MIDQLVFELQKLSYEVARVVLGRYVQCILLVGVGAKRDGLVLLQQVEYLGRAVLGSRVYQVVAHLALFDLSI